jgi:hypothetical protein
VVIGCLCIGCVPWMLAAWTLGDRNEVLGRILIAFVLLAVFCVVAAQWLNAKAGGRVDF